MQQSFQLYEFNAGQMRLCSFCSNVDLIRLERWRQDGQKCWYMNFSFKPLPTLLMQHVINNKVMRDCTDENHQQWSNNKQTSEWSQNYGLLSIVLASLVNTLTSGHTSWPHQNSPELTSNSWDFISPPPHPSNSILGRRHENIMAKWSRNQGLSHSFHIRQMFQCLYKQFCLKHWVCEVSHCYMLHATVVVLAGSGEHISLTQKEIKNCAVEQLTSLCAGPTEPQPTHPS